MVFCDGGPGRLIQGCASYSVMCYRAPRSVIGQASEGTPAPQSVAPRSVLQNAVTVSKTSKVSGWRRSHLSQRKCVVENHFLHGLTPQGRWKAPGFAAGHCERVLALQSQAGLISEGRVFTSWDLGFIIPKPATVPR